MKILALASGHFLFSTACNKNTLALTLVSYYLPNQMEHCSLGLVVEYNHPPIRVVVGLAARPSRYPNFPTCITPQRGIDDNSPDQSAQHDFPWNSYPGPRVFPSLWKLSY